jgi:hypothetical protein
VCALGPLGPFSASLRSPLAPGPLPLRGSRGGLRARARFAAPVRRLAPCGLRPCRRRARGVPPGSLARVRAASFLRPSRPARWPRLAWPSHPLRCGLPVRSPFLCSGSAVASAWPRRVPPSRALRASGPGCSRPGAAAASPPSFAPAPGRWLRGRPGGLAALFRWVPGVSRSTFAPALLAPRSGFSPYAAFAALVRLRSVPLDSPLRPPRPAAPAGGSGGHEARTGGLRPPLRGLRFSQSSCGTPRGPGGPARAPSARLTIRKL